MKKALILTHIKTTVEEKELLMNTNIFKIALNQHAEDLMPDVRIITDYTLKNIYENFSQKIISVREHLKNLSDRVVYPKIEFKGSTILAAIDWLILENYTDILILGDNNVNSVEFQNEVREKIDKIKNKVSIYQYTNGNFDLPIMSIQDFIYLEPQYRSFMPNTPCGDFD